MSLRDVRQLRSDFIRKHFKDPEEIKMSIRSWYALVDEMPNSEPWIQSVESIGDTLRHMVADMTVAFDESLSFEQYIVK